MLAHEPVALAGVTGKHLAFCVENSGDVNMKIDGHGAAVAVVTLDGMDEVKMRDLHERSRRIPLPRCVVGARGGKASISHQQAGHLMVCDVVRRRGSQNDGRRNSPEYFGDPPPRFIVVEDCQIAEFQTDVPGTDQGGRRSRFLTADGRDRLCIVDGAAAVTRSHRGDRQLTTSLAQQDQGTGALKLDVVRMCMQGQNLCRRRHGFSPKNGSICRYSAM